MRNFSSSIVVNLNKKKLNRKGEERNLIFKYDISYGIEYCVCVDLGFTV